MLPKVGGVIILVGVPLESGVLNDLVGVPLEYWVPSVI